MRLADFDYPLPPDRIAQEPLPERDSSRLLIVPRSGGEFGETVFRELPARLRPGDLLVVNDTRVRPFRIAGKKESGGSAELTLTGRQGDGVWECLYRGRGPRPGLRLELAGGLWAELLGRSGGEVRVGPERGAPLWRARIEGEGLLETLEREGRPPLPPYIRRVAGADAELDRSRYQTVYAEEGEAAAAPTAGFHFSPRLLARLAAAGVGLARLRLDVSYGTFAPVRAERIEDHIMHPERFFIPEETARAVAATREAGGRVIAVGTTVVRALEHRAREAGAVRAGAGETALFIYPGFEFRVVDAMITNFHLPRSTLLMLVSAFAGRERILAAYRFALARGFRFLSYGDASIVE
jgi:S-adenosylmethionine:tRNA ribosyltransferase-isomerase